MTLTTSLHSVYSGGGSREELRSHANTEFPPPLPPPKKKNDKIHVIYSRSMTSISMVTLLSSRIERELFSTRKTGGTVSHQLICF